MKKTWILINISLLILATTQAFSSVHVLKGTVQNSEGKPYPFVYVSVQGIPDLKTTTELDGTFALIIPDSIKIPFALLFHSIGAEDKTYKITATTKLKKINITLQKIVDKSAESKTSSPEKTKSITRKTPKFAVAEAESKMLYESEEIAVMDAVVAPSSKDKEAAGQLTAGELNDFSKWGLWEDIAQNTLQEYQKSWQIFPNERYVAQLTNQKGMPILDAMVFLKDNQGNTIWQARTDNTGKAELWASMLMDSVTNTGKPYNILFKYKNVEKKITATAFPEKINVAQMDAVCSEAKKVDIDFIVDATGSMGDEIMYLQAELYDVIEKVQANNEHIELRTGTTFYRDIGDAYVTRTALFDRDISKTINFIKEQKAGGGGDTPEAVDAALTESIENRDWNISALARIAFLILDAPPHSDKKNIERIQRQIRLAAMKGIRIVPLVCSGADKSTEYLMRSIALATNGTYVFLTDESGIGGSHIKPTTDKYEVEKLNHILMRIINEFCLLPNCENYAENATKEMTPQDKFVPRPYKEEPVQATERFELSSVLNIHPNPCNGVLNIELFKDITDLFVADITGKSLQKFAPENLKSIAIDLYGYSTGIYFINAFCQGRWYTTKFILAN